MSSARRYIWTETRARQFARLRNLVDRQRLSPSEELARRVARALESLEWMNQQDVRLGEQDMRQVDGFDPLYLQPIHAVLEEAALIARAGLIASLRAA